MAISAQMRDSSHASEKPREPRRNITIDTTSALGSGDKADVTVHNVSASGMLIECLHSLSIGETLTIDLPNAEATPAKVVWTSGRLHGCQFAKPVSTAVLSAAQLRGAVEQKLDIETRQAKATSESFAARLQRLRKKRGLSLAQIAVELEVSTPTVWAWEQGRSRPMQGRIDLLAQVLGTSSDSLLSGRDDKMLDDLLDNVRRQVAQAYGTRPEAVKIVLEL